MSKKKWLILIGLGVALCVVALVSIAFLVSVFLVVGAPPINPLLPVYTIDQGASAHPGYRRTTATSGTNVYVSDFEEQMLQLQNYDPNHVIGRSPFGGGKICSIPGQPPTAYIAVDEGSEMPGVRGVPQQPTAAVRLAPRHVPVDGVYRANRPECAQTHDRSGADRGRHPYPAGWNLGHLATARRHFGHHQQSQWGLADLRPVAGSGFLPKCLQGAVGTGVFGG